MSDQLYDLVFVSSHHHYLEGAHKFIFSQHRTQCHLFLRFSWPKYLSGHDSLWWGILDYLGIEKKRSNNSVCARSYVCEHKAFFLFAWKCVMHGKRQRKGGKQRLPGWANDWTEESGGTGATNQRRELGFFWKYLLFLMCSSLLLLLLLLLSLCLIPINAEMFSVFGD